MIVRAPLAIAATGLVLIHPTPHRNATPACVFKDSGALPDQKCTPGAVNRAVTQTTIAKTICKPGWATSVRPSETVTEPQKFAAMRQYGIPTTPGHAGLYEYDHLIPLELGGALDSPKNLWPEPHHVTVAGQQEGSYAKDTVENRLNSEVCHHTITLAAARREIRTDWPTAR